eukprot:995912-Prymnesium_polylepis.1
MLLRKVRTLFVRYKFSTQLKGVSPATKGVTQSDESVAGVHQNVLDAKQPAKKFSSVSLRRQFGKAHLVWMSSGMQLKLKVGLGLYQCIAAVPTVFGMRMPEGVSLSKRWDNLLDVLQLPNKFGLELL